MRAASHGLPFEPIVGLTGSDIPAAAGLKTVKDPYTGAELHAVPAIRPDWAILHVQEADALGNARIYGSPYWDVVMSRAAARAILTAERILPPEEPAPRPRAAIRTTASMKPASAPTWRPRMMRNDCAGTWTRWTLPSAQDTM